MEIQNESLRYIAYGVVLLIALFAAIKIFPLTLSVFTVLTTSPIGLAVMLISFVFYVIFFTGLITSEVIEPKKEPTTYDPHSVESIKKFSDLSEQLQKNGLKKVSERIIFFEANEKPVVIETVFRNDSAVPITFGYALQFMLPNGNLYGGTATEAIHLNSGEEYAYSLISPSNISGAVIMEKKLETKGIFLELK